MRKRIRPPNSTNGNINLAWRILDTGNTSPKRLRKKKNKKKAVKTALPNGDDRRNGGLIARGRGPNVYPATHHLRNFRTPKSHFSRITCISRIPYVYPPLCGRWQRATSFIFRPYAKWYMPLERVEQNVRSGFDGCDFDARLGKSTHLHDGIWRRTRKWLGAWMFLGIERVDGGVVDNRTVRTGCVNLPFIR